MTSPRLPPAPLFPLSWLPFCTPESVDSHWSQPVDFAGGQVGVQATLGRFPCPPQIFPSSSQVPIVSGSPCSSGRRNQCASSEGCHRGGGPNFSWFLRPPVYSAEKDRRPSSCSRPVGSEQIPSVPSLQDGICSLRQGSDPAGRLGYLDRPQGRVLPHSYQQTVSQVAAFPLGRQSLPVSSASVRPLPRPLDLHTGGQGTLFGGEAERSPSTGLPRRLAYPGTKQVPLLNAHFPGTGPSHHSRFPDSPREVIPHSVSEFHISGHGFQHGELDDHSLSASSSTIPAAQIPSPHPPVSISSPTSRAVGPNGVSLHDRSLGTSSQEGLPTSASQPMVTTERRLGHRDPTSSLVSVSHQQVDGRQVAGQGCSHCTRRTPRRSVHGRVHGRLGSPCRVLDSVRNLVPSTGKSTHQSSGDDGCFPRSARVPVLPLGKKHSPVYGQYHCDVLHQQTGGGKVSLSLSPSRETSPTVRRPPHRSFSSPHSRQAEHFSGLSEPSSHSTSNGVDANQESSSSSVGLLGQTHYRSVCIQVQLSPSRVCLPSSGSKCMENRCSQLLVAESGSIRIPSSSHFGKGVEKGKVRSPSSHSHCSKVASATLVSGSSSPQPCPSSKTASGRPRHSPTKIRNSTRQSRNAPPTRLAAVRSGLRTSGASEDVINLVSDAHRSGTKKVYDKCWESWTSWCRSNKINPVSPPKMKIANFLAYLGNTLKLSTSSVKVHRAAICSSLRQLGHTSYSEVPLLRDVIRSLALKNPRIPRRVPAWDLFLVLASLREPPFEPLEKLDLESLTLKTVFLISLASGRRCSEIHALSGLDFDIKLDLRSNSYTLQFLPEFIAKNQQPNQPSPSIIIPPISSILPDSDDPDSLLCPVRSLRRYLHFTKTLRDGKRRLFISQNPGKVGDIKVTTISRWISSVVRMAYLKEGSSTSIPSHRAHELRALAASLRFSYNWRLQDVLDAAFWKSENTFINYYLRDVRGLRQDGSFGISAVVAAQLRISI